MPFNFVPCLLVSGSQNRLNPGTDLVDPSAAYRCRLPTPPTACACRRHLPPPHTACRIPLSCTAAAYRYRRRLPPPPTATAYCHRLPLPPTAVSGAGHLMPWPIPGAIGRLGPWMRSSGPAESPTLSSGICWTGSEAHVCTHPGADVVDSSLGGVTHPPPDRH